MTTRVYPGRQQKMVASAAALGAHLLFIALLVLGVSWHRPYVPPVNVVDLWAELPAEHKAAPPPPPPPPEVRPQPQPKPVPAPVAAPPSKAQIAKADIALKEKEAKERRILEEKQKDEKKQREAEAKATAAKAATAKTAAAQRLKEQKALDAQRLREDQEAKDKLAKEQAAAQARQTALNKMRGEYIDRIRALIKHNIVLPPELQGNPEAEFEVTVLSGGSIMNVRLKRSSGDRTYDAAVERAIVKTNTLPMPTDPALAAEFRELNLKFRPKE